MPPGVIDAPDSGAHWGVGDFFKSVLKQVKTHLPSAIVSAEPPTAPDRSLYVPLQILPSMSEEEKPTTEALSTVATDTEKGTTHYADSTTGLDHKAGTRKEERRLVRKLDMVILPLTACLYVRYVFLLHALRG